MRSPMPDKTHVTDLLHAAKLLADADQNTILSYLICMALLEAQQSPKTKNVQAA